MKKVIIIIICLFFASVSGLNAQNIINISLIKNTNKIYISAEIDQNIPEPVFEFLYNGVQVTLLFTVNIYKERPFFLIFDKKIKSIVCEKIVEYNMWEKQYCISENNVKTKILNKKEVNSRLKKIENVYLIAQNEINKEDEYYGEIQASMESVKLYPPFDWIVGLMGLGSFKTSWVSFELK